MKPERVKAPFLTPEDIEQIIETTIRKKFEITRKIPVDVLAFAEFDLELQFEFAPIQQLRQDAFLRPDLTGIWFDEQTFKGTSYQHRLRFSAAHEFGHFFLHKDIYGALNFISVKQWIAFIGAIPANQYYWIERHADEFAGRFLMPTTRLAEALEETMLDVEREGLLNQGTEWVLNFCSRAMHSAFGVSQPAIQTRIRESELWPHRLVGNSD